MPYKDLEIRRAYSRVYRREKRRQDPEFRKRQLDTTKRVNEKIRENFDGLVREFRSDGCLHCDEREDCCLVAHHVDPSQKLFNIADARQRRLGREAIEAELAKCICLCHNCHAKLHSKLSGK